MERLIQYNQYYSFISFIFHTISMLIVHSLIHTSDTTYNISLIY